MMETSKQNDEKKSSEYKECFVAFLDILGFTKKVNDSQDSEEKLKVLTDSLSICGTFPPVGKKVSSSSSGRRTISIHSGFFSDTIVFFMKKNPKDISQLFFLIRYLQDRLWEKGLCLRGGVSLGEMYWPVQKKNIILGPALIEAHKLESTLAIYPRILVSKQLYDYIYVKNICSVPFGQPGELKEFICRDNDGMYFLDLLKKEINRPEDEKLKKTHGSFTITWSKNSQGNKKILKNIDGIIKENIGLKFEKIYQKYQWLKTYKEKKKKKGTEA